MIPVLLAVMLWGDRLQGKIIVFHIDNQGLVQVINKQTTKSKRLMTVLREFILLCMQQSIIFKATYISTKLNTIADSISRKQWSRFRQLAPNASQAPQPVPEGFRSVVSSLKLTDE